MSYYSRPGTLSDEQIRQTIIQSAVVECVCSHFLVDLAYIRFKSRDKKRMRIKQITIHLLKANTKMGYKAIAAFVGLTDHTTTRHHLKYAANMIATEDDYREEVETLKVMIDKRLAQNPTNGTDKRKD